MTEEVKLEEQPAPAEERKDNREGWPPELWPVVERHGPEIVGFCVTALTFNANVQAIQGPIQNLSVAGRTVAFQYLRNMSQAMQAISNNLTLAMGWTSEQLQLVLTDVQRAQQLAAPAGNRLILPS